METKDQRFSPPTHARNNVFGCASTEETTAAFTEIHQTLFESFFNVVWYMTFSLQNDQCVVVSVAETVHDNELLRTVCSKSMLYWWNTPDA